MDTLLLLTNSQNGTVTAAPSADNDNNATDDDGGSANDDAAPPQAQKSTVGMVVGVVIAVLVLIIALVFAYLWQKEILARNKALQYADAVRNPLYAGEKGNGSTAGVSNQMYGAGAGARDTGFKVIAGAGTAGRVSNRMYGGAPVQPFKRTVSVKSNHGGVIYAVPLDDAEFTNSAGGNDTSTL